MSQAGETFFTAVGCMDGRVQQVVAEFGQHKFGTKYPDTITEAGIVGMLAGDSVNQNFLEGVKFKVVDVSIGKHHSSGVVVHGHAECAGNPVSDDQQKADIRKSVEVLKSLIGSTPIVGVFLHRNTSNPQEWEAEELL